MLAHIFVWLFVFTVPWQNMIVLPGIGTISSVLGMGAIAASILHVVMRGRVRSLVAFYWLAIIYMAWVFLSAFWGIARHGSIQREVNTYLQISVMLWVVWEASPTARRLINLLQAYVLGAYVAAGSTVRNFLTGVGIQEDAQRYSATGFDPNDLGVILALALPMAWYIASTTTSTLQRWLNRLYLVIGTVGILLTGSRGALLAMVVALSVVPWTLTQVRRGVRVAAIVLGIAAAALAVNFVPEKAFERLGTTGTELSAGDLNSRLRIWKGGLAAVPNAPFRGHGPGGWYPAVGLQIGNVAPHNTWLAVLVEEGLVGLILFISMFAVLAKSLLRLPVLERRTGLVQLATLMVGITPLSWQQHKAGWLTLALLAAWGVVLARQQQPEELHPVVPPMGRRGTRGAPVPI